MKKKTHPGTPYSQSDLGLDDDAWATLTTYVETIEAALREEVTAGRGVEAVEENPPRITEAGFDPGGWVGLYPGDVTIVPRHLSDDEYRALLDETQDWVEVIGATTIAATLPLSTELLVDVRARLAAYSEALIELTETLRAHRLPVEVQRTRHRGFVPEGRPLFDATMRESAQGSRQVVSEQTRFSFDTLLNHLLVRFHVELLGEMQELAGQYDYYRTAFERQIDYHEGFVGTGIPSQLVDQAVETDFASPAVLAEARRQATDEMAEVVDLWEAFQRDLSMQLTLSNQLNTAVKPISKLYELWCLRIVLKTLTDLTGATPTRSDTIAGMYHFGDSMVLHYNRALRTHSRYFRKNLGVSTGKPDFALEVDGTLTWIGDAKFKDKVRQDDYRRFLTYLVDLLGPDRESSILYVADDPLGTTFVRDYPIRHTSVRPRTREQASSHLTSTLNQALASENHETSK